jgi:hypothetical protein
MFYIFLTNRLTTLYININKYFVEIRRIRKLNFEGEWYCPFSESANKETASHQQWHEKTAAFKIYTSMD